MALSDILDDLQHDLGKHLALPVRMLPADADEATVRAAVHTALWRTRRGPSGVRDAASLWAEFRAALGEHLDPAAFAPLTVAIERALAWRSRVEGPLSRRAVEADLVAVGDAIWALRSELDDG